MSEITKYEPQDPDELRRLAVEYAESGLFTDAKKAETALVKIYAGAELGLGPFQSMSGVHLIQGKPVVGAGLLASLLDRDPDYDYNVAWEPNAANPTACTITVFKHDKERGQSRFSLEDAQRAGLSGGNWQKYPSAMLFARAISQAVRWYAPGATGTSVYVEGELTADVEAVIPQGVTAKPRVRVTAEVIRDAEVIGFDPATEPPPSVAKPPTGPLAEPLAAGPLPLKLQLTHMSAQQKADLWSFAGLERNTKMADVKARLVAFADELGMDFTEEPDAKRILDTAKADERASLPSDAADTFQHFADTGQDLTDDPQTAIA